MGYIEDINNLMNESYTRVPENANALEDLIKMRKSISDLMQVGTPNVPAGMPNGMTGLGKAYAEVNEGIRALMNKDLDGHRWQ